MKWVYAVLLLVMTWVNQYFWFLPNNDTVEVEPYSIVVQAIDKKTSKRLDTVEFRCHVYGNESDYVEPEYKNGLCYFYNLEPEINYVVSQISFEGSYIPEVRESTVYVNVDGTIDYLLNSHVDKHGILTFKNYLAGRDFYSEYDNITFWVILVGLISASVLILVVLIVIVYKSENKN